jgi:hypothetical protein
MDWNLLNKREERREERREEKETYRVGLREREMEKKIR